MPGSPRADAAGPEQLVDALNAVFGKHPARASHAKGQCVRGSFSPTPEAVGLSKSPIFAGEVPLLARFSMGSGNPKIADAAKGAPRGLAVRFESGEGVVLVMLSTPMFFARTPEQMLGFLQARVPAADGKPEAEKVKAFAAANPETTAQSAWLASRPVPASYATVNYWAVHAFTLTNADGVATTVKLRAEPGTGEVGLSDEEAKAKPADFYVDELRERLASGPATFTLVAIIGEATDPTGDPTVTWPEDERRKVALGTLRITALEDQERCDAITFDPTVLAEGIAGPADDPTFAIRSEAYAISRSRRTD